MEEGHDRIVWGSAQTGAPCPRCGTGLVESVLEGQASQACPQCRGVMLSNDSFGSIVRQRRADYRGADLFPQPMNPDQVSDTVDCPVCSQTMEIHPYYGPGNQMIDSCNRCGLVWIDSGELTAIERAPGLR
jgi:Zn-finger nucleic acid-binding protein